MNSESHITDKGGFVTEINRAELEAIRARYLAATAGPWKSFLESRDHTSGDSFIQTSEQDLYLIGATVADQDFIAYARQDLPPTG